MTLGVLLWKLCPQPWPVPALRQDKCESGGREAGGKSGSCRRVLRLSRVIYWPVKSHDPGRMINTLETSSNFKVSYFDAGTNLWADQPPLCALSSMPDTSPEGERGRVHPTLCTSLVRPRQAGGRGLSSQDPNVSQVGGRDKRPS